MRRFVHLPLIQAVLLRSENVLDLDDICRTGSSLLGEELEPVGRLGSGYEADVVECRNVNEHSFAVRKPRVKRKTLWTPAIQLRATRLIPDALIQTFVVASFVQDPEYSASSVQELGRPLPKTLSNHMFAEAAFGLYALHTALGVAHMDVKFGNLLLNTRGRVVLTDIGGHPLGFKQQGSVTSTWSMTPPEWLCRKKKFVVRESFDTWSLGSMLFASSRKSVLPYMGTILSKSSERPKLRKEKLCPLYEAALDDETMVLDVKGLQEGLGKLLQGMLQLDPTKRMTMAEVLCDHNIVLPSVDTARAPWVCVRQKEKWREAKWRAVPRELVQNETLRSLEKWSDADMSRMFVWHDDWTDEKFIHATSLRLREDNFELGNDIIQALDRHELYLRSDNFSRESELESWDEDDEIWTTWILRAIILLASFFVPYFFCKVALDLNQTSRLSSTGTEEEAENAAFREVFGDEEEETTVTEEDEEDSFQ